MKKDKKFVNTKVTCSCGSTFETKSNKEELHIEVCSNCHPTYTGKGASQSKTGKVEKFKQKYGIKEENN